MILVGFSVANISLDGSRGAGSGYGSSKTGNTGYGSTGGSATAGPHSSNLANKADPRVDSDLGMDPEWTIG